MAEGVGLGSKLLQSAPNLFPIFLPGLHSERHVAAKDRDQEKGRHLCRPFALNPKTHRHLISFAIAPIGKSPPVSLITRSL